MRQALSSALLAAVAMAADLPTQHNDVYRTGANLQEHELTPAVVRSGRFGKLFSISVNGQVYAQPLVATGIEIDGHGPRDVVFVATMENNVYAFDANSASEAPFWKVNVGPPVPYQEIPQGITTIGDTYNIRQWIGITSTPVVDRAADRLFLTAKIKEPAGIRYRLFSLNTANGNIVRSTEITVNQNGRPIPDFAFRHLQRPGLLLSKGLIYVAFGAHQDPPDQTGWILAFSAETLEQKYALGTTERGNGGGIWQAGNGPAADDDGNLYFMTGNGDFNQRDQLGTSFVKVSPDLRILSWFTPRQLPEAESVGSRPGIGWTGAAARYRRAGRRRQGRPVVPAEAERSGGPRTPRFLACSKQSAGSIHPRHARLAPDVDELDSRLVERGVSPLARLSGLLAEPERTAPLHLGGRRQPPQLFLRPGDTLQPQSREKQGPSA
jgi:hypothetical protein